MNPDRGVHEMESKLAAPLSVVNATPFVGSTRFSPDQN
jgi:hypothetical protein